LNTNPYKAILRNANAGYWDLDFSNSKFELSDVLKRIFEWPDLQISSFEDWLAIVHPDDRQRLELLLKDVVNSKGQISLEGECKFQRKNGFLFLGKFCGEIIEWTDDNLPARFVGCIFDITLRRQSDPFLALSEERFKGAFENSSVGMAIIDLDGKWLRNNKRMAELFGYTSEELSQLRFQDITYPDDLEADLLLVNATLEGMIESYQVEKRYFHKSGSIVHGLLSVSLVRDQIGKPIHFISQIQDVTAFKKSQEELFQTNKRLEAILFAGKDVSIIATDLNGIITIFSPGAEELTGYRASEVVGIHSPLILHKKEELNILSEKLAEIAAQSFNGFEIFKGILKYFSNTSMQWTYVKKNGEGIPVQLTVSE
jgi:PAS domain S-box-containing protein